MRSIRCALLLAIILILPLESFSWGFFCHKLINKYAVFLLPPEMVGFYKKNIEYLIQHSVDPDKRSHGVEGEAEKHYIDIDHYGNDYLNVMPKKWKDAVEKFSEDTLREHGILPWNIEKTYYKLVEAFKTENVDQILNISANFGHYIADSHVPLHNSQYYDGRALYQKGVHALWESRVPELLSSDWTFFLGTAKYIKNPLDMAWKQVALSNAESVIVLDVYDSLLLNFKQDNIYVMDERGSMLSRQYSLLFCQNFEQTLQNMVYRKLCMSVFNVASLWFSAWVDAGQPDLDKLMDKNISKEHEKNLQEIEYLWKNGKPKGRPNPEDE